MAQTPYLTPNTPLTADRVCYRLKIPDDRNFLGAVKTALLDLLSTWRWEPYGTMTPEQCSRVALDMYNEFTLDSGWCMIGAIFPYASAELPANTLLCDGSIYDRVDFPDLYAVLDAAFIVDSDHFSVPMMQGYVPIGAGADIPVWGVLNPGDSGGEYETTLTEDTLPAHSHSTLPHSHSEVTAVPTALTIGLEVPAPSAVPGVGITGSSGVTVSSAGNGQAHNNVQPYIALNYCIVAR